MMRRIASQLPAWARPDHPILRYELSRLWQPLPPRARYLRALAVVLLGLALGVGGYAYYWLATDGGAAQPGVTESIWRVLFFPALAIQVLVSVIGMLTASSRVVDERRRQTWDNLRVTTTGAGLAVRTRWASVVFYRLRSLVVVLMLVRLALILGVLYDLMAFRGGYLDMLTANIVPEVALPVAVLLLALTMTAAVLLPWTGVGMDAALGLLIATTFRQNFYTGLAQVLYVVLRVGGVLGLLLLVTRFLQGEWGAGQALDWLLLAAFGALGDWGLLFLHLASLGELWVMVPYALFLGLALLLFALLQAALTDGILALAVRQAERAE